MGVGASAPTNKVGKKVVREVRCVLITRDGGLGEGRICSRASERCPPVSARILQICKSYE